jgi:hypothetical protein
MSTIPGAAEHITAVSAISYKRRCSNSIGPAIANLKWAVRIPTPNGPRVSKGTGRRTCDNADVNCAELEHIPMCEIFDTMVHQFWFLRVRTRQKKEK